NAPGSPNGIRTPPKSPSSSTTSATRPTSGSRRILSVGGNGLRRTRTPPIEPSSAARGTTRRAQSPAKARPIFVRPMASVAAIPTFHASTGSPVAAMTGPSTPNTIANRVGVSMPNGIAVTSSRPVRCRSLTASPVYARSPTRTPSAVPGTIRPRTRSAGNLKTPIRRLERMTSCVTLSRARPRNPLRSPDAFHPRRCRRNLPRGRRRKGGEAPLRDSALVEAAREALLTPFLIDEGRLPALLAEVADLLAAVAAHHGQLRRWLDLADVLGQRASERVRERQDLGGPEARRLAAADPRELADDLFKPSLSREGRRQPQHKRNQPPERLGHGHRVRPTLADLHEDLEGFFLRRFGHRDPGRPDRRVGPVRGPGQAPRTRPDDR